MKPSQALDTHRAELRTLVTRFGLLQPRVFGSVATGSDEENSDLDLLVDPTPGTTLLTLAALQNEAERLLGVTVDVQTPNSISARFRNQVLKQALAL